MVINQIQMSLLPTAGGWALKPRAERDLFCTALLQSLQLLPCAFSIWDGVFLGQHFIIIIIIVITILSHNVLLIDCG